MTAHVVTAGYVTVSTAVPGGRAAVDLRRGTILPDDVSAEDVQILLARGHIAPIDEGPAVDVDGDGVPDGSVAQILAWVGTDPGRAAQALAAENTKPAPRKSLTDALGKLTTPPPPPPAA